MKRKKILLLAVLVAAVVAMPGYGQVVEMAGQLTVPLTMVIDAGHGGMDSGASAKDGTSEKDINLAIAKALAKQAEDYGRN